MQLATYIQDLLYRYECVIIPGFGAFLTHYQSAKIDGGTHTLYPPGKTIAFNRQLQTNDGLLANYIASVDGSSYETALTKLRHYTGNLSLRLSEGETVVLDTIGEFYLNNEQSVQFIPSEKGNFSTASFGLHPFASVAITREADHQHGSQIEEQTPILFTPERREKYPYLKYAAIGLVAIALAGFGGLKLYERDVTDHNFVERQKADSLIEKQIQEATFVIDNPLPAVTLSVPKQAGKYHIVAGAFRIEDNAHKKIKQLKEKGYSARYIGESRYGLHQVVYSSHKDRLEALQTLRSIKNSENSAAWLLVQELD